LAAFSDRLFHSNMSLSLVNITRTPVPPWLIRIFPPLWALCSASQEANFWVVRSAPLELENAGGVFHLLAFDHRYLTPSERERECQLALDRKVFGRAARVETSRWIVAL
jgi:hypothetical protein